MEQELMLKYGCNPNQKPSRLFMRDGGALPFTVLNGKPGYINFMDALNSWQLVRELKAATGLPAAASFKHVSPAGAAVAQELSEVLQKAYRVDGTKLTPLASAYAAARGADRMSSYGDFIALSDVCDVATARIINRESSDGVVAPGYAPRALEILKAKRGGGFTVIQMDTEYRPKPVETREIYGITFEQGRNELPINEDMLTNVVTQNKNLTAAQTRDLLVALITLKYTQSNSVCYVKDGATIGVGAGQQSRIHCTRLAGEKADTWYLRQHPKVLSLPFRDEMKRSERDTASVIYISDECMDILGDEVWRNYFTEQPAVLTAQEKKDWLAGLSGVALGSDAFFPMPDNVERAVKSGVCCMAQPGGSIRDDLVIESCDKHGVAMVFTGARLFHH